MTDGVIAAVGRGSGLALAGALDALDVGGEPILQVRLGPAVLAAFPAWRLCVAEGPAGTVALAAHGRPALVEEDPGGAAAVRALARWTAEGLGDGLSRSLEAAAARLAGRFAVVAACSGQERLLAVRRGRSLVLGEAEGRSVLASGVGLLPAGLDRVSQLEREGVTAVRRPSLVTLA